MYKRQIIDRTDADSVLQTQIDSNDVDIMELETNQDDLIILTGISENITNLGNFTNTKINNNTNIKEALEEIGTELDIHENTINNHDDVDVTTTLPVDSNIMRFDGNNWVPSRERQFTQLSGRFEIDNDDDWACWSDPSFGPSLQDWDFDLGNGTVPNIDWDGEALLFPRGATFERMVVKVRGNNGDIDSVQLHARVHDADFFDNSLTIDSIAEVGAVDLTTQTINLDAGNRDVLDMQAFEIDLTDYTFLNDGDLHIMMRSVVGSTAGNRQLRTTIFIEWELPV